MPNVRQVDETDKMNEQISVFQRCLLQSINIFTTLRALTCQVKIRKSYCLPKLPWTHIFLTSLKLDNLAEKPSQLPSRIVHALYQGPCGLKSIDCNAVETCDEDMKVDPVEIKFPENFARKEEEPAEFDIVINRIHNKLCI